jgi:sugar lactone lactonase YvrE
MVKIKSSRIVVFSIACFFTSINSFSQSLEKLWTTDTVLKVPESVLFDAKNERLFVSNIDGKGVWDKDRKGSISLVTLSGKVLNPQWINGLHAPKGMALFQTILLVADVDSLVFIETTRAAVVKKIYIQDAKALNDVAIDKRGNIYVSDSKTKKIHMIGSAKLDLSIYLDGLEEPNGICFVDKTLYFVDGDGFYKLGKDKEKILIAKGLDGNPDGVEQVDDETFLVSCWSGMIWQIKLNGEKKLLIDTSKDSINAADIGFDKKNKIVFVPAFWKNYVTAYKLN